MASSPGWPAPRPRGPVCARLRIPGSKSLTNRWLVLAALAVEPTTLLAPLASRDTELMAAALRRLGVSLEWGEERAAVRPADLTGPAELDCGLAGTVMRFLLPVAALATGTVRLDGDARARERPLAPLTGALRALGAEVSGDALPVVVQGNGRVRGGTVQVDASASSQLVSALLLAAPRFDSGLTVQVSGEPPSQPHLDMTVACLRRCGVAVDDSTPGRWQVSPGPVRTGSITVEPDLSNAAPFLAAALVCGGEVRIADWPHRTTQPGDQLRDLLNRLGATVTTDGADLVVRGDGTVRALDADLREVGELTPVLAALAALADGPSRLTGIAHLRGHETDRIAALATELGRVGAHVEQLPDGLAITPGRLSGAQIRTYDDHRMATFGAVLGLRVRDIVVEDIEATGKTLPTFPQLWRQLVESAA